MKLLDILRKIDAEPEPKNEPVANEATETQKSEQVSADEQKSQPESSNVSEDKKTDVPVSVQDQRVNIEDQMNELSHQYAKLRNDLKTNLFTDKDNLEDKKATLENYLATIDRDQTESTNKLNDIKAQNDDAEKERLASVRADQKEQNEFLTNYKEQQENLDNKISESKKRLQARQDELAKNENAEANLSNSIKEEQDLQKMMVLMEDQKNSINKLYQERKGIQKGIDDINEEITSYNKELKEVIDKMNSATSNIDSLKSKTNQIESKIKSDRNYRIETTAGLERHLKSLSEDNKRVESELSEINGNIAYIEKYIKDVFHSAFLVRDVYLNKDKDYFILADSIDTDVKMSNLFDMVHFIEAKLQKQVTVISTFYSKSLADFFKENTDKSRIEMPNIISMFDQLQMSSNPSDQTVSIPENDGWITRTDVKTQDTLIYDQNNNLLMTVEYDDTKISRINYYKNNQVIKSNIYNQDGQLAAVQIFNKDKVLTEQSFYRTDGSIVLTVIFEKGNATSYQLFDNNGLLEHDFNKKEELITWWLNNLSVDTTNGVFVGSVDDRLYNLVTKNSQSNGEQMISLIPNAQDNIDQTIGLLTDNANMLNVLVEYDKDLQAIERSTNRDISVSVIKNSNNSELYLPDSLTV